MTMRYPYKAIIKARLREVGRSSDEGGVRVDLRSEGSTYDVEMAVHGLIECTGKAADTVTDTVPRSAIYYPAKGRPRYHLILSRAFFAFTCGGKRILSSSRRSLGIGTEPPPIPFDPSDLETTDPEGRYLEGDARMSGSFTTSRQTTSGPSQDVFSYEYRVRWEICRGASYCSS